MATVRAQIVRQGASGFPEDRFVNTIHFAGGVVSFDAEVDLLHPLIAQFWNTDTDQTAQHVGEYQSAYVTGPNEVRYYDLTTPEPRVPRIEVLPNTSPIVATDLPEEVCVALSFRGAPPVTARRRGRIFIGPLNTAAMIDATSTQPSRPSDIFVDTLWSAADRLRQSVITIDNGCVWCIRSVTPFENFVPIFGGWVDNAFDTQRRRGPEAISRDQWGIPL